MQNINRIAKFDRVDSAERTSTRIFNHLKDTSRPETLEWFCLVVFFSDLRLMQRIAESALHLARYGSQIFLGGSDPE